MASADGTNGGGRVRAEYVWLGLDSCDIRCKTRVLERAPTSVADLPDWSVCARSRRRHAALAPCAPCAGSGQLRFN